MRCELTRVRPGYTVLSAFGLFYAGFGFISTPVFGIAAAYEGRPAEYNNALGLFVTSGLMRAALGCH